MRQEIIYSLLAVAAVPVTVNAAIVPTGTVTSNWTGAEVSSGTVVIATAGTEVTCNLGELVPGKYQLVIGKSNSDLTIKVEGKQEELKAGSNGIVEFDVDGSEPKTVVFTVIAKSTATLESISLNLNFDFKGAYDILHNAYIDVFNEITSYGYAIDEKGNYDEKPRTPDQTEAKQVLDQRKSIEAIEAAESNVTGGYESVYKAYGLWKGVENSTIYTTIETARQNAITKEIAYQGGQLDANLAATKTEIDKAPAYAQNGTVEEYTNTSGARGLIAQYNALKQQVEDYKAGKVATGWDDIKTSIVALNTYATKAAKDGADDIAEYKKVQDAIQDAYSDYSKAYKELTTDILKERIVEAIGNDIDRNKNLREEADADMQKQYDAIGKINLRNEEYYGDNVDHSNWFKDNTDGNYEADLKTITDAINDIKKNYTNYRDKLIAADKTYTDQKTAADKALEANKDAIAQNDEATLKAKTDLEAALKALLDKINSYDTSEKRAETITLTDETTAVTNAKNALTEAAEPIQGNINAYNTMTKEIAESSDKVLSDYLAKDKKYKDFDPINVNYKDRLAEIQALSASLKAVIKKQFNEGKAKEYYAEGEESGEYYKKKKEYDDAITAFTTAVDNDVTNYKNTYDAINGENGDGKSGARYEYTALYDKIKTLSIYLRGKDANTTYHKPWMDALLKQITDVEEEISEYLAIEDFEKLGKFEDRSTTISTKVTKVLKAANSDSAIEAAESAFKQQQEANHPIALAKLVWGYANSIDNRIKSIEANVADDKTVYGIKKSPIKDDIVPIRNSYNTIVATLPPDPKDAKTTDLPAIEKAQDDLEVLESSLIGVEDTAKKAEAKVKANNEEFKKFGTAVYGLKTEYDKQYEAANKNDLDDEKKSITDGTAFAWKSLFTTIKTKIDALATFDSNNAITKIKDPTILAEYNNEDLSSDDYSSIITEYKTEIENASKGAATAQANALAYNRLNAAYTTALDKVNKALAFITTGESQATMEPDSYYTTLWNNAETGYTALMTKYKGEIDAANTAFGFTEDKDATKFPVAVESTITENMKKVADEAELQPENARLNKVFHDAQVSAINSAEDAYKKVSVTLSEKPVTTLTDSCKTVLADLNKTLKEKEALAETNFNSGKSNDDGTLTTSINTITNKMNEILNTFNADYDESVKKDNDKHYAEILDSISSAKKAYLDATEFVNQFKGMQSTTFAKALEIAESNFATLDAILKAFPAAINALGAKAQSVYAEKINTSELFDYKPIRDNIVAEKKKITDGLEEYQGKINEQLSTLSTAIKGYEEKLSNAKAAIKAFSEETDKEVLEAYANAALQDVITLISELKDAQAAFDITSLDKLFAQAEDQNTGISKMIEKDKNAAAAKELEAILKQCEAKLSDYAEYMAKQDEKAQEDYATDVKTLEGYREDFNKQNAALTLATNFSTLKENYQKWLKNNTAAKLMNVEAKRKALQVLIEEREAALAAATKVIEKYAAAGTMKKFDLADIQAKIDEFKKTVDETADTDIDNLFKARKEGTKETEPEDDSKYLQENVDDKIKTALGDGLVNAEYSYLSTAVKNLTSAYYTLEGKDKEAAAEFEESIFGDQEHKVKSLQEEIDAIYGAIQNEDKTVDDLFPYEAKISTLTAALTKAIGADNTTLIKELTEQLETIANKAKLSSYSESIQNQLATETAALSTKIEEAKSLLADTDNINFNKSKIDNTFAQLDKEADALIAKAETLAKAEKEAAETLEELNGYLDALKKKLDEAVETLNDTERFEKVNSSTYSAKLSQIETSISDEKTTLANDIANGKTTAAAVKTEYDSKDGDFYKFVTETGPTIEDLLNTAARREVILIANDLSSQLKAITYNPDNYLDGEAKHIAGELESLKDAVGEEKSLVNGGYHPTGLYRKAKGDDAYSYKDENDATKNEPAVSALTLDGDANANPTIPSLKDVKDEAKGYAERITVLVEYIGKNAAETKPEIIPGDITGTGEVTDDDVEAMIKKVADLPADFEPTEQELALLDVNGDGKVNIGDVIATYNVSVGLNWDGSDPDYTGARQKAAENAEQGNVSIEATGLGNGVTRLVLTLDSPMEFIAFQTDVLLANGVKIVGEQLSEAAQGLTLTTNDVTDTRHRVMGYSFSSSINNGAVLQIDVEGDDAVAFDDIYFTTRSAKTYKFEVNGITGISTVSADTQDKTVYDLRGKVVKSLKKGVNLVRDAFGNVKKILVK